MFPRYDRKARIITLARRPTAGAAATSGTPTPRSRSLPRRSAIISRCAEGLEPVRGVRIRAALQRDREPAVAEFTQPATVGELVQLPAQRLQLAPHLHRQAQHLADGLDRHRPARLRTMARMRW